MHQSDGLDEILQDNKSRKAFIEATKLEIKKNMSATPMST